MKINMQDWKLHDCVVHIAYMLNISIYNKGLLAEREVCTVKYQNHYNTT